MQNVDDLVKLIPSMGNYKWYFQMYETNIKSYKYNSTPLQLKIGPRHYAMKCTTLNVEYRKYIKYIW